MFPPNFHDVIRKCSSTFTDTAQILVAVEESAEFIQAAMKYINRNESIDSMIAEAADAMFLLFQVRSIVGPDIFDSKLKETVDKVNFMIDYKTNKEKSNER